MNSTDSSQSRLVPTHQACHIQAHLDADEVDRQVPHQQGRQESGKRHPDNRAG